MKINATPAFKGLIVGKNGQFPFAINTDKIVKIQGSKVDDSMFYNEGNDAQSDTKYSTSVFFDNNTNIIIPYDFEDVISAYAAVADDTSDVVSLDEEDD